MQVVRDTALRPVPGGHIAVGAGDARPGHGVSRAVFQLYGVRGGADQRRPVRYARRRGVLPAPLPAVCRHAGPASAAVVVVAAAATAAAAVVVVRTAVVATPADRAAVNGVRHVRPVAVPVQQIARISRARSRRRGAVL